MILIASCIAWSDYKSIFFFIWIRYTRLNDDCMRRVSTHFEHGNPKLVLCTGLKCQQSLIYTQYQVTGNAFITMTSSNGNIYSLLALCEGTPLVTGGFPPKRPVARNSGVFFDMRLNKRLRHHRAYYDVTIMIVESFLAKLYDLHDESSAFCQLRIYQETFTRSKFLPWTNAFLIFCLKLDTNSCLRRPPSV